MSYPDDPNAFSAVQFFSSMPEDWQTDPAVQDGFNQLFFGDGQQNWDAAHDIYYNLHNYIMEEYGEDLDDYFDWDDWRESYDETAA